MGFRNILVHTYIGVNLNLVKEILEKRKYRDLLNLALKIVEKAQEKGIDP
ncbi:MAG: HepT-like ribonuclease domain-containing protein [Candidatus Njordarchaeia archaeon]